MNYLEWVDNEIDQLQRAIVKLTIAREVIVSANKALSPKNRVDLGVKNPAKKRDMRLSRQAGEIRRHIVDFLGTIGDGWAEARAIANHIVSLQLDPPVTHKAVWNQIYLMKVKGTIVHDKVNGVYQLLKEAARDAA